MNEFLHVGFDAYINVAKVKLIVPSDNERIRRELKKREIDKNSTMFWNTASGREIKSLILFTDGMLVASALTAETLVKRFMEMKKGGVKE